MTTSPVNQFYILGIAVRTTNENGQATKDIPQLWNRFMSENIAAQIPNKVSDDIYCLYTDYEGDYTRPYTTILGCRVHNLAEIPAGFTSKPVEEGEYTVFTAKGKIAEGVVFQEWQKIWSTELPRNYGTDFEVYGSKAKDPDNAAIDIFIGLK
jgi:predicted transcriptional regulator YdeE